MKKAQYQSKNDVRLIQAGLRAQQLEAQLAATYAASTQIIEAMRTLREGLPDFSQLRVESIKIEDVDD